MTDGVLLLSLTLAAIGLRLTSPLASPRDRTEEQSSYASVFAAREALRKNDSAGRRKCGDFLDLALIARLMSSVAAARSAASIAPLADPE